MKNISGKQAKSGFLSIINELETVEQTADSFNNYFQSVFNPSDDSILEYSPSFLPYGVRQKRMVINSSGVAKLLNNHQKGKAPGPDGLSRQDLCIDVTPISQILRLIFQYSIYLGELPNIWKIDNVVPIFKKGSKSTLSNYRPVSLTCICCKMMERIVISNFNVDLNNHLNEHQHGFRGGLSCTTQLATVLMT